MYQKAREVENEEEFSMTRQCRIDGNLLDLVEGVHAWMLLRL